MTERKHGDVIDHVAGIITIDWPGMRRYSFPRSEIRSIASDPTSMGRSGGPAITVTIVGSIAGLSIPTSAMKPDQRRELWNDLTCHVEIDVTWTCVTVKKQERWTRIEGRP